MEIKFGMEEFGNYTMPDEEFKKACAGYCRLAMKRVGVSKDAIDCIIESLWEEFGEVSVEAARGEWDR